MKQRRLIALAALAMLGFAAAELRRALADADGGGKTFCVGGFEKDRSGNVSRDECAAYASRHPNGWHLHGFAKGRDGYCYACWDEVDNTCESDMPTVLKGQFKYVGGSVGDCNDLLPAEPGTGKKHYVPDPATVQRSPPPSSPPPTPSPSDSGTGTVAPPVDLGKLRIPPPVIPDPIVDDEPEPVQSPGAPPRPPRPKPKPPRVVPLTAQISHVSQGPYAVGDTVQVEANVVGDDGRLRRARIGYLILKDPAGAEKLRVPVTAQSTGIVTADVKLPDSGNFTLTFEPVSIDLPVSEKEGPITSTPLPIAASQCRLRGVVLTPKHGEILVANAPMTLTGEVRNLAGKPVGPGDLHGAKAVFTVDLSGGQSLKLDATVDASGTATAPVTLPAPTASAEDVVVRLLGEGGGNDFCADAPVTARTTLLGIGMAMTLPPNCYAARPCNLGMQFQLPDAPDARSAGLAFLSAPDLRVEIRLATSPEGTLTAPAPADPGSAWSGSFTPRQSGVLEIELVATAGGKEVREKKAMRIREPIELHLTDELDLGTVAAGSDWRSTCKILDFAKSRGVEEQTFFLESTRPKGCDSTPAVKAGGLAYALPKGLEFELGFDKKLPICLIDVPRCSSESPDPVELTVRAKSPDFPDQTGKIRVRWKVTGRSFWACHWWWLVAAGGAVLFVIIAYGYLKPYSFAVHDAVKLASKREGLARATARRLRELPGGRSGFYRSAKTGLREDGSATNSLRSASVTLSARRGEVILHARGGLQRVNPQSKKMEDVATGADGHVASKNIVYSVGSLFFQLS